MNCTILHGICEIDKMYMMRKLLYYDNTIVSSYSEAISNIDNNRGILLDKLYVSENELHEIIRYSNDRRYYNTYVGNDWNSKMLREGYHCLKELPSFNERYSCRRYVLYIVSFNHGIIYGKFPKIKEINTTKISLLQSLYKLVNSLLIIVETEDDRVKEWLKEKRVPVTEYSYEPFKDFQLVTYEDFGTDNQFLLKLVNSFTPIPL